MKKTFLIFQIILFSTISYSQNPLGLKTYVVSFYDQIQVSENQKVIAFVSKKSVLTYSAENYYKFRLVSSLYSIKESSWIDVDLKFHLDEKISEEKDESNVVSYMYRASMSDGQKCLLYFGVNDNGFINHFFTIINLDEKYYYTELLKSE